MTSVCVGDVLCGGYDRARPAVRAFPLTRAIQAKRDTSAVTHRAGWPDEIGVLQLFQGGLITLY